MPCTSLPGSLLPEAWVPRKTLRRNPFVPGGDVSVSVGWWDRHACLNLRGDDSLGSSVQGTPRELCPRYLDAQSGVQRRWLPALHLWVFSQSRPLRAAGGLAQAGSACKGLWSEHGRPSPCPGGALQLQDIGALLSETPPRIPPAPASWTEGWKYVARRHRVLELKGDPKGKRTCHLLSTYCMHVTY